MRIYLKISFTTPKLIRMDIDLTGKLSYIEGKEVMGFARG
jgi:hypothetical protein